MSGIRTALAAGVVACTCGVGSASAQAPGAGASPAGVLALVLDETLTPVVADWRGVEAGEILAFRLDVAGRPTSEPVRRVVAAIALRGVADPSEGVGATSGVEGPTRGETERWAEMLVAGPAGLVELTDGQRLAGDAAGPASASEDDGSGALWWSVWSADRRAVSVPLERLSSAWMGGGGGVGGVGGAGVLGVLDAAPEDLDVIVLANGDEVGGFVASLSGPAEIEPVSGGALSFDLGVVSGVSLANPDEAGADAVRVWLDDGSVVGVRSARVGGDGLTVLSGLFAGGAEVADADAGGGEAGLREDRAGVDEVVYPLVSALSVARSGRIVAVSSLEPASQAGGGASVVARRLDTALHPDDLAPTGATPLGLRDVVLPGPMRVSWSIPEGATRFAATAALDSASARWGDCELVVRIDGAELARGRLAAGGTRTMAINVAVPAGARSLEVSVEAGAFGEIGDRVALRRPMLLMTAGD